MLYPVYVHPGDASHAHGVIVPDFAGCFSAADSWDDLPSKVQEAVEVYCEGEDVEIPQPTPLDDLVHSPEYSDGVWMLVDIDVSRLDTRARRVDITLPGRLLRKIDAFAALQGESRSGFLARAAVMAMQSAGAPAGRRTVVRRAKATSKVGKAVKVKAASSVSSRAPKKARRAPSTRALKQRKRARRRTS
ncbi:MAG: type II toxin-antitoxin system HicB family antitoxin [Mizugakiibacter sp.]|uniref:type II toxin-antitoxin system HicB family antitoxin n=1 Tax=Mizugakiibacter sp. TaxID=1972610 RepID=UPI0031C676F2|nr:type II toxin-antitoxin system HicB family antitoxin [Xanthomonadaceae bacterium]